MAEKIKLRISAPVAAYLRPGLQPEDRIKGVEAACGMDPHDRVTLLFCLSKDADPSVRNAAASAFSALPEDVLAACLGTQGLHPSIVDAIAHIDCTRRELLMLIAGLEDILPQTREFVSLNISLQDSAEEPLSLIPPDIPDFLDSADDVTEDDVAGDTDPDGGVDEEGEEYLSKFKMASMMGIADKIKMALTGDKEWRSLLIKDANKLVSGSVVKNPRITDGEILAILKVGVQNDEIIRIICANKEWTKKYSIRKALVDSPRTPVQNAMRYLATMTEKDLAHYAKSKNISSVISTQAKRMLLSKKK